MPTAADTDRAIRRALRIVAVAEAITWAGLLVSLLVKYPLAGSPGGVTVWGWAHGIGWIVFILVGLLTAVRFRWAWWVIPIGLAMSATPFFTVAFDIWMERSGRLSTARSQPT